MESLQAASSIFPFQTFAGCMTGLGVWLVAEDVIGVLSTVLPSETIWDWLAYGMIVTGILLIVTCTLGMSGFLRERRRVLVLVS